MNPKFRRCLAQSRGDAFHEPVELQICRLTTVESDLHDIRGEEDQRQDPSQVAFGFLTLAPVCWCPSSRPRLRPRRVSVSSISSCRSSTLCAMVCMVLAFVGRTFVCDSSGIDRVAAELVDVAAAERPAALHPLVRSNT